ncbi:MAG TPA: PepSY-like domain-containing protein [Bacteroidia bacterium]|nr:PepSY-like domain-containing protein [Bacteroidia bacterium]
MKSTIITAIALVFVVNTACAQKVKETEVPKAVVTSFETHFKGAKAKAWDKEKDGGYEAEFDWNKVETSATFSAEGKLKETEQEIKVSELPKIVTEYVAKNYAGHKIAEAAKITDAEGKMTYEAEVKKGKEEMDLLFDDKGNFIKKTIEAPEKGDKKD